MRARAALGGWLLASAVLLSGCDRAAGPAVADRDAVTQGRWKGFPAPLAEAMARGVNVSNWFQHRSDPDAVPGWPTADDFAHMRRLGLGHVRLMLDPDWLQADAANAAELQAGIDAVLAADLRVVLALQPSSATKQRLAVDDGEAALHELAVVWRALAVQFAAVPADRLLFEVLNEPEIEDGQRSLAVQARLVEAAREAGPKRWAVISGAHYSDVDDLAAMPAPKLPGVIYGFHFYEPHNFTHQGATWGWPMWAVLRDLPYPSSPVLLAGVLPRLTPAAREHADWYGQQAWDREKLQPVVRRAAEWADRHGVPVWCSEFGVLRDVAPPASRRAWLTDVRELFEQHDIAWSHFDWWGHFGLVTGEPGARVEDADALAGLGLVHAP